MIINNNTNFIKEVSPNLFDGKFSGKLYFNDGLNIISGSNGVGKTQLLIFIQSNRGNPELVKFNNDDNNLKNIAAFSPKRNATKTLIEQAQHIIRSDQNARNNAISQFLNQQIQDIDVQTIKSISEYVVLAAEDLVEVSQHTKDSSSIAITNELSEIINRVFSHKIKVEWDANNRRYNLKIIKNGIDLLPSQLSSGENALISFMLALYHSRDSAQVFLVDEPEIHLNWELEEKLFNFLDWFAQTYQKQFIVVTHSRVCFLPDYVMKTKFLSWEGNIVVSVDRPTSKIQQSLAGDIVNIISGITIKDKLVYVEDKTHKQVLEKSRELLSSNFEVSMLNSCSEVMKFSKAMKGLSISNAYFLVDNDNQPVKSPNDYLNLVKLNRYCIENYFFDKNILSKIDKRPDKTVQIDELLKQSIKQINQPNFAVVKSLINNNIDLTPEILDRIDGSEVLKNLWRLIGFESKDQLIDEYLTQLHGEGELKNYFDELKDIL